MIVIARDGHNDVPLKYISPLLNEINMRVEGKKAVDS